MTQIPFPISLRLALVTFAVSACQPSAPAASVAAPADLCEAAAEPLANLTYSSELVESGNVALEAGEFRAPAAPGSASEVVVRLTENVACGDLDSLPSAAVILVSTAGGSGTFSSLHAVQPLDAASAEVAYTMLGDRVKVEQVSIDDNRIYVELITHGQDDPLCCPTQAVVQAYALEGGQLRLESSSPQASP